MCNIFLKLPTTTAYKKFIHCSGTEFIDSKSAFCIMYWVNRSWLAAPTGVHFWCQDIIRPWVSDLMMYSNRKHSPTGQQEPAKVDYLKDMYIILLFSPTSWWIKTSTWVTFSSRALVQNNDSTQQAEISITHYRLDPTGLPRATNSTSYQDAYHCTDSTA